MSMAEESNPGTLRQLAADLEQLESAASGLQEGGATAADAGIPDLCGTYHSTIRPPLIILRDILCSGFVKGLLGPTPCNVLTQVIAILDRICPATSPA